MAAKRSTKPPFVDPDPTLRDLPRFKLAEREKRERAVLERLATGNTASGVAMYAVCAGCRATVRNWRQHLHQQKRTSKPPTGVILEYPSACSVCGGSVVEIHAEDRPKGGRAAQPSSGTKTGSGRRSSRAPSR